MLVLKLTLEIGLHAVESFYTTWSHCHCRWCCIPSLLLASIPQTFSGWTNISIKCQRIGFAFRIHNTWWIIFCSWKIPLYTSEKNQWAMEQVLLLKIFTQPCIHAHCRACWWCVSTVVLWTACCCCRYSRVCTEWIERFSKQGFSQSNKRTHTTRCIYILSRSRLAVLSKAKNSSTPKKVDSSILPSRTSVFSSRRSCTGTAAEQISLTLCW